VPEQLVFALAEPGPPTFANFVAGANAEAMAALHATVREGSRDVIVLWGAPGAGKSHLLQAAVTAAAEAGRSAHFYPADEAAARNPAADAADFVAVDDVHLADADAQRRLFTLFNEVRERGGTFLASSAMPPTRTTLRDDLRTRLGWGLTLEVHALADADKPAALAAYARDRGLELGAEVVTYLLTHARRDMPALVATIAELDRYSLARKRPVTLPLLRDWMMSTRLGNPPL
jgi:DnaA family protein